MGNPFDVNKQVAMAHVRAEQLKGWFLANAKMLLIILSGAQLFMGVVMLAWGDRQFVLDSSFIVTLLQIAPMAVVGGLLAICIEGGTVFSSAMRKEASRKIDTEMKLLDRVRNKLGSKEVVKREKEIKRQAMMPLLLMLVCIAFSVTGAEVFWQTLFSHAEWYYHILGGVLGITCSSLLIIFEMNTDLIEDVIERCISSSSLVQTALDMSAKSTIHDRLFEKRTERLASPEFERILEKGAEQGLLGVVVEAVQMSGMNVSVQQLQQMIDEDVEDHEAAEAFIASGGDQALLESPKQPVVLEKKRVSKHRKAVEDLVQKYGAKRVATDLAKYSEEVSMDVRTLEKHLKAIMAESA